MKSNMANALNLFLPSGFKLNWKKKRKRKMIWFEVVKFNLEAELFIQPFKDQVGLVWAQTDKKPQS